MFPYSHLYFLSLTIILSRLSQYQSLDTIGCVIDVTFTIKSLLFFLKLTYEHIVDNHLPQTKSPEFAHVSIPIIRILLRFFLVHSSWWSPYLNATDYNFRIYMDTSSTSITLLLKRQLIYQYSSEFCDNVQVIALIPVFIPSDLL